MELMNSLDEDLEMKDESTAGDGDEDEEEEDEDSEDGKESSDDDDGDSDDGDDQEEEDDSKAEAKAEAPAAEHHGLFQDLMSEGTAFISKEREGLPDALTSHVKKMVGLGGEKSED